MARTSRPPIPVDLQIEVYFRDHWLCHLCRRPTILHLAMKFLSEFVGPELPSSTHPALWDAQWRRDKSPLLDELAASIDHVQAFASGGAHNISNFATVCARCNARKSARRKDDYLTEANPWVVKGKYGEPVAWDGLASVFVVLAKQSRRPLATTEQVWLRALEPRVLGGIDGRAR